MWQGGSIIKQPFSAGDNVYYRKHLCNRDIKRKILSHHYPGKEAPPQNFEAA